MTPLVLSFTAGILFTLAIGTPIGVVLWRRWAGQHEVNEARAAVIDTDELETQLAVAQADKGWWRRQAKQAQQTAREMAGLFATGPAIPLPAHPATSPPAVPWWRRLAHQARRPARRPGRYPLDYGTHRLEATP